MCGTWLVRDERALREVCAWQSHHPADAHWHVADGTGFFFFFESPFKTHSDFVYLAGYGLGAYLVIAFEFDVQTLLRFAMEKHLQSLLRAFFSSAYQESV